MVLDNYAAHKHENVRAWLERLPRWTFHFTPTSSSWLNAVGRQVQLAFDNLKATLKAAGCTFDDIVDVTTFHTDPENQFETIMTVKNRIFSDPPYPNWTAIGVNWLAGFDFEIKVIARIPEDT